MEKMNRGWPRTEFRQSKPVNPSNSPAPALHRRWHGSRHPADADLHWFVNVRWHEYASCYVWIDCPIHGPFGDIVGYHKGNTIYLNRETRHQRQDLLHEAGHAVGRHYDLIGHRENHYSGSWERKTRRLIGAVSSGRHWSAYLNRYSASTPNFEFNAASEIWAELFMLYYLYPYLPEAQLIEAQIEKLRRDRSFGRLHSTLQQFR